MRPVQLDMTGFASFRDRAVVDFTGADYFALVGPTGSGRSTVIDAMTFALYGSVPRWGRRNAIADALAPTTNRCTVRLVFDHLDARYVVAREVRRSGASILQKNVILERLPHRQGIGADGEAGEVIAGDLKEVNEAVEGLLGLSFDDFCKCIVLPQGQFADFLKATPKDRQTILLKLLGADQYDAIGRAAAQRAAVAGETVQLLTGQLADLADATELAELEARERERELARLAADAHGALPAIALAADRTSAATAERDRLSSEHRLLTDVQMPEGTADLQAQVDRVDQAVIEAIAAEATAFDDDSAARAALAALPPRRDLELLLERIQERDGLSDRRAEVAAADRAAAESQTTLRAAVDLADARATAAREARETARRAVDAARRAADELHRQHLQLAAVVIPAGTDVLARRSWAAVAATAATRAAREAAEKAEERAREELGVAPARPPLEQARRDLADRAAAEKALTQLTEQHRKTQAEKAKAEKAVIRTRAEIAAARSALAAATALDTAAALRPQLHVGDHCPVCEQEVLTLPRPLPTADLDQATGRLSRAEAALAEAEVVATSASRAEVSTSAEIRAVQGTVARLTESLAGRPGSAAAIDSELAGIDSLVATVKDKGRALSAARTAERAAETERGAVEEQSRVARTRLRTTHSPLLALGAPEIDESDLLSAWTVIGGWAGHQIEQLDRVLMPAAAAESAAALRSLDVAQAQVVAAEQQVHDRQADHTAAVRAAVTAAEQHRNLGERLAQLITLLEHAPTETAVTADLARHRRLTDIAGQAEKALATARSTRTAAERERTDWQREAAQGRRDLRAARDRLVFLGAPELDDEHLAAAWGELAAWATQESLAREAQVATATQRIDEATRQYASALDSLLRLIGSHGIDVRADIAPAELPALLATELERAHGRADRIAADRTRAAHLTVRAETARQDQQVAGLLADLLRSNKFPRWLAAAALDTLVADASAVLFDLSAGQFDLTHDKGEFVVIDHTDADSSRSVRTLSGGETFQASLALALALAAQMSTPAGQGAARLDSIFLDEGFGTLDPDTLEVVAGTLENLAHGERMVGVITHVATLADRAPVRFAVRRDHRTSSVVREGS